MDPAEIEVYCQQAVGRMKEIDGLGRVCHWQSGRSFCNQADDKNNVNSGWHWTGVLKQLWQSTDTYPLPSNSTWRHKSIPGTSISALNELTSEVYL
jgi:hypothetical protein